MRRSYGSHGSHRSHLKALLVAIIIVTAAGCSFQSRPPLPSQAPVSQPQKTFEGRASFYHDSLSGSKMANGEVYGPQKLVAAHRTLPFGTRLRVTNKQNGEKVIVTVADRGPHVKGRVLDLSRAAAQKLGCIDDGVVAVRVEVL